MKKIVLIVLTILSFAFTPKNIQNDKNLISSGKWRMEYVEIAGKKVPLPADMIKKSWATYHTDGRTEGVDQKGTPFNGKWEYLQGKRAIKVSQQGKITIQQILSISNSKLIYLIKQQQQEVKVCLTKK